MCNPQRSIELLDQLEALGFTDEAFQHLHHARVRGWRGRITAHRAYCDKTSSFQDDGDNARVQRRLELVLRKYRAGGHRPYSADIFVQLADAAFAEIPPLKTVGKRVPFKSMTHGA